MKAIIQRVSQGSVSVDHQVIGNIEAGLVILIGIGKDDSTNLIPGFVRKIVNMRIFSDSENKFQHSLLDIKGGALLIPQFTLFADTRKGRRPEFFQAMAPDEATKMFDNIVTEFGQYEIRVQTGKFGAHMIVSIVNDGPVTIPFEMTGE